MPYYSDEDEDLQVDMSQFELRPRPGGPLFYYEEDAAAPPSSPPDDRPPAIRAGKRGPLPQRWSPPPGARQVRPVRSQRAASPARLRSPSPARRRSPSPAYRRSPPVDRRYPSAYHRSPSPAYRRSPSPSYRRSNYHRSPSPGYRRSPSPAHHRSPSPGYRRSLSPAYPHQSPPPHYSRSPSPTYRRTPVESTARSPRRDPANRSPSPSRHARSPAPRPLQSPNHRDHLNGPFIGLPLARMKITNGHQSRSEMQNHRERIPNTREPPRQASRRALQRDVDTSSDDATLRQRRPPPSHRRSKPQSSQYPSNQQKPNKSLLPTRLEPTAERQARKPTRSRGRSGYSPAPDYDFSTVPHVPEPDY
ncbi:extensin-2-like [Penaeus monodon]|uniref:extensin-2-like n=1 Tax=Penaeus monodon TaxID=6687 RepID=UPI0018A79FD4|nr:extensin-2-like [Penaeus monodon]XP_037803111.1 extensin-2-like [Penaeus monodon]XP_037803112.1 extensin-2-like [Penaeus monodon]